MASEPSQAEGSQAPKVRLPCARCGRRMHLPVDGALPLRCPDCGEEPSLGRVHALRPEEFARTVLDAPIPVLVDFHAEWCGPCRWLDPILSDLARDFAGRVLVVKVDADQAGDTARELSIGSVPTVVLFEAGRESERSVGVEPERLRSFAAAAAAAGSPGG